MTSCLTFFLQKTTKGDINVMAFSTFYNSFTYKNVLITKSVQKRTDIKSCASLEPKIPRYLYKEVLGV